MAAAATLPDVLPVSLSAREREVLRRIVADQSAHEIAAALCMSRHTVDFYRRALHRKAGTHTAVGLVVFALRAGWVQ